MRNTLVTLLITLFMGTWLSAQVKIGDNPQNIDPASVLELESTDKVLVITRVTTAQMNAIVPSQGALCYNTELQAVHYYDGTQWLNIGSGGGTGGPLTADPIVNPMSTIVITPTATGDNLEVAPNSISSEQIIDGGVNGIDIQDGSIGPGKLQNNSVTEEKLSENSVGAFALDNDNIGVSAFNNDVGYITAGDLNSSVSADTPNSITAGSDGGAFYDDTNLMNDVLDNAAAIALDDDQSSANEIQNPELNGTLLGLSLTGGTVDLGPLISGGGSDNQNLEAATLDASNMLTIDIEDGNSATVDLSSLAGGGGTDDQNLETPTLSVANVLTLNIEGGNPTTIDLSPLASGTGSTELVDGTTLIGDGTTGDRFRINPSATVGQYLRTTAAGVVWDDVVGGGNQNLGQVLAQGTDGGAALIKNILNPVDPQDAATRAYVDAAVISGGGITNGRILIGGAGDVAQQLPVSGDAALNNLGVLTIEDDVIESDNILNGTILGEDLNNMGALDGQILIWDEDFISPTLGSWVPAPSTSATNEQSIVLNETTDQIQLINSDATINTSVNLDSNTIEAIDNAGNVVIQLKDDAVTLAKINQNGAINGDILKWDDDGESLGVGGWVTTSAAGHTGISKSIFYANDMGDPVEALNPDTNATSLIWDYEARVVSGTAYGALGVGMDGATINNVVKMHVVDNNFGALSYPFQIQNNTNGGSSVGMIFSAVGGETQGKGVLAFESTGTRGRGDFHFLQDTGADATNADLNDKSFTIRNNKDIVLYGGIDIDGTRDGLLTGTGLGTSGQVLSSTGTGLQWINGGAGETNTADNIGTAGLGLFANKTGAELRFKNINGLDANIIIVSDDVANNELDLDIRNESIDATTKITRATPITPTNVDQMLITEEATGDVIWTPVASGGHSGTTGSIFFAGPVPNGDPTENNTQLFWDNTNDRLGVGTNVPDNKFHVTGAIRSEGILNSDGIVGEPSYRFSGDTNTGFFTPAADQIGFSVGGAEAAKVERTTPTSPTKLIVNENLELDGSLLDFANNDGDADQVLSSNGTTTLWVDAPDGAVAKGKITTAGTTLGNYTITFPTALASANYIINTTVQQTASGNPIMIQVTAQTSAGFSVQINEFTGVAFVPVDAIWFYTIYNP